MRTQWTPAAIRALDSARRGAEQQGGCASVHLLLALVEEEEGRAARMLTLAGISLEKARSVIQQCSTGDPTVMSIDALEDAARKVALDTSGEAEIGSEHLLLAALQAKPELVRALESAGLAWAAIEKEAGIGGSAAIKLDDELNLDEPRERIDIARIIDANVNRAREALRVVEDYCRFALGDAFLSRELKALRHDLTQATADAGLSLLPARDTQHDVGTTITTASELKRDSLADIAQANFKRLQEALRSLEEHGKLVRPELGAAFEKMRYRTYTLERAVLLAGSARSRLEHARLYAIVTGAQSATALDFLVAEAAAGGVDMVQLREKELPDRELLARARKLRAWTRDAGVLFIVNDRPDIARLVEADGVHLGQDDLPVHDARRIVGPEALIGVSTHTLDQVRKAVLDGADYIGVGPVFPSATKGFTQFPGLDFVRAAAVETALPAFALGGITRANLDQVVSAGATRIAVSAEICRADEPRLAAQALRQILDGRG